MGAHPAKALAVALPAVFGSPALAACPQELAIYSESGGTASVEFTPNRGEAIAVSNKFRLLPGKDIVLDGIVMWSEDVPRPNGRLMHACPEGDVTGAEIEACTVWQGVIYAIGGDGRVDLLPAEGKDAAEQLLFPDIAWALKNAVSLAESGLPALGSDTFTLSGCQE